MPLIRKIIWNFQNYPLFNEPTKYKMPQKTPYETFHWSATSGRKLVYRQKKKKAPVHREWLKEIRNISNILPRLEKTNTSIRWKPRASTCVLYRIAITKKKKKNFELTTLLKYTYEILLNFAPESVYNMYNK